MSGWNSDDLSRIGNTEEIQIASVRRDGTFSNPTTIWTVRVDDDLYIRSIHGRDSIWFRGTQARREGYLEAGGVTVDVTFESPEPGLDDQIDEAYRAKYHSYAPDIVGSVLSKRARDATLLVVPRAQQQRRAG